MRDTSTKINYSRNNGNQGRSNRGGGRGGGRGRGRGGGRGGGRNNNRKRQHNNNYDKRNTPSHMVRISNLPHDFDEIELKNLIRFNYTNEEDKTYECNWNIGKCFIMRNRYGVSGMLGFRFENQAKYVVDSLDKTPFVNQMLKVEILPPRAPRPRRGRRGRR